MKTKCAYPVLCLKALTDSNDMCKLREKKKSWKINSVHIKPKLAVRILHAKA